jgi:hypothetical protein
MRIAERGRTLACGDGLRQADFSGEQQAGRSAGRTTQHFRVVSDDLPYSGLQILVLQRNDFYGYQPAIAVALWSRSQCLAISRAPMRHPSASTSPGLGASSCSAGGSRCGRTLS